MKHVSIHLSHSLITSIVGRSVSCCREGASDTRIMGKAKVYDQSQCQQQQRMITFPRHTSFKEDYLAWRELVVISEASQTWNSQTMPRDNLESLGMDNLGCSKLDMQGRLCIIVEKAQTINPPFNTRDALNRFLPMMHAYYYYCQPFKYPQKITLRIQGRKPLI